MTAAWKLEDFQAELAYLEDLHKIRPDSDILQNMANTICKRIQAIDVWTAHGLLGLTSKAEALQVPPTIKDQLAKAIETSCAKQGSSHLKLTNAGQIVQDITPYLTQDDWTKLESSMPQQDCMVILAKRLVAMGLTGLKEQTTHQVIGLLRYLGHLANRPDLSPSQANQAVKDFVAVFKAEPPLPVAGQALYPSNPWTHGIWARAGLGSAMAKQCQQASS